MHIYVAPAPSRDRLVRATYRSSPNGLGDTLMQHTVDITALIIEELYCEANVLADEVRTAFVPAATELMPIDLPLRRALECEGLKATTRIMHVLAWLLNHRAFLAGQMSDLQWERHTQLPPDRAPSAELMDMLDLSTRALVAQTQRLHARVARIDAEYRMARSNSQPSCGQLHERLERQFAQG